jgi:ATP-dependent Clp protease protease subunit
MFKEGMAMSDNDQDNKEIIEQMLSMNKAKAEFLKKRMVFLWGQVDDKSAEDVTSQLLYLDAVDPGKEIKFYINSPGGVVTAGMVIYDTMKLIKSPVITVCMGLCASMGSILLSGGEKGKRLIYPSGRVMIHQPSIGKLFGQASDIQIHAKEIARTKEMGARVLAENCSKSVDELIKDFDRDFWMNAEESVKYGIVDKIVKDIDF